VSELWLTIAALAVINISYKAFGPVLAGGRALPPVFDRMVAAAIPALMIALVVVGVFSSGTGLVIDARAGGLVAAVAALALRAPLLLVLAVAAAATAVLRMV
jgi:hypothetical protein